MIVNFVMSSSVESKIFNDIFNYFCEYSKFKSIRTIKAIDGGNIYYYFRPHLEKKLKNNSIVTVHHDLKDSCSNLDLNIFLERYREAKLVICLNSIQKKILFEYGIKNTIIIPHGYNDKVLTINKKTLDKKLALGFFSNYYPRLVKGEDYLLKLAKDISVDTFKFIIVGNKREKLTDDLIKLGFECELFENVNYSDFNNLYKKIDCLLITSKFEGGPASVPESLATCTPILSTKVGMVNDLYTNKGISILTRNIVEDLNIINALEKNLQPMKDDICFNTKKSLQTWKEIIVKYDMIFMKYSFNAPYSTFIIRIQWYRFSYFLLMKIKKIYKKIRKLLKT